MFVLISLYTYEAISCNPGEGLSKWFWLLVVIAVVEDVVDSPQIRRAEMRLLCSISTQSPDWEGEGIPTFRTKLYTNVGPYWNSHASTCSAFSFEGGERDDDWIWNKVIYLQPTSPPFRFHRTNVYQLARVLISTQIPSCGVAPPGLSIIPKQEEILWQIWRVYVQWSSWEFPYRHCVQTGWRVILYQFDGILIPSRAKSDSIILENRWAQPQHLNLCGCA